MKLPMAKDAASIALLFPGQGAQTVGMGADVYAASPAGRAVFDETDATLGFSLSKLILKGPPEELRRTEHAQPAIFCVSIAYLRAVQEQRGSALPTPTFVAGHSLGEYTALVAAGALDLADGVRLVQRRGQLMQKASDVAPSSMAAILGLRSEQVQQVCMETGARVANVNSAEQSVIAGTTKALERATALAKERGARRVVPLEVSGAFHTHLMQPAQKVLDAAVDAVNLRDATTPILANTTALPIATPREIRQELSWQLCGCVLWQQSVEYMATRGVTHFLEVGPGRVLTGLAKRIAPDVSASAVGDLDALAGLAIS
jgi:[acyl-carrier-protein] S-malonyltransferase